jgi:acetylornithine/succinyldiaminopimelate/putrescine aminotransferase
MEKTCCGCKKSLSVENFKSHKTRKDGLQSQCIECQKKYRREHYLLHRRKYINKAAVWKKQFNRWWKEYKRQFSCSQCGESHPACIQFHHPNKDKDQAVSVLIMNTRREKALEEISKCIPLCANCHFKLHWKD